jgi:hypothetical protein
MQNVSNTGDVENQVNAQSITGDVYIGRKSRFSARFEKLNKEVASESRYPEIMDSLKFYITELDGIDMPTKLIDGGFSESEIIDATRKKERYAKKQEKNKFFESAQWIDDQLLAKIKILFDAYINPMIKKGESKEIIYQKVIEHIVDPIMNLINDEGEADEILNYNADDVLGMIYYLTGKCHLNWKIYASL